MHTHTHALMHTRTHARPACIHARTHTLIPIHAGDISRPIEEPSGQSWIRGRAAGAISLNVICNVYMVGSGDMRVTVTLPSNTDANAT